MAGTVGLIQQNSGQAEWYTPLEIVEAARRVMGGIDLDPASSAAANARVAAKFYFDRGSESLARPWVGNVWLNPPFADNAAFVGKLLAEYADGRVQQACVITFASLDTAWARRLMTFPRWIPEGRVAYIPGWEEHASAQRGLPGLATAAALDLMAAAGTNAPPKASMVTYIGPDDCVHTFVHEFTALGGQVDVPWAFHERRLAQYLVPRLALAVEVRR